MIIPKTEAGVKPGGEPSMSELHSYRDQQQAVQATGQHLTATPDGAAKADGRSGIVEQARKAAQHTNALMLDPILYIKYDEASQGLAINYNMRLMTRAEFESLVTDCRRFFDAGGDEFVEQVNREWDEAQRAEELSRLNDRGPGIVYLVWGRDGLYKIGLTRHLKKRLGELARDWGFVVLEHQISAEHAEFAEHELHTRYWSKHVDGEWFKLTDQDVADIQAIERM